MSEAINKVLYNVDQTADTTAAQKAQARANIGAQGLLTAGTNITIDANNVISALGLSEVFYAEYGVATVSDISAARNAGKLVFTLIPGTYYPTAAYLREVTRNGANANFGSVVSDGASVKIASVDSEGAWTNSTVNLATASSVSGGKKRNVAELYFDYSDDGDVYGVRGIRNYCVNHVVVHNHSQDICLLHIDAPAIASDEEYDYTVVFDCTDSSGACNVTVENADAEIFATPSFNKVSQWLNVYGSDTPSDAILSTREILVMDAANNPKYLQIGRASYQVEHPVHQAGPCVLHADSSFNLDNIARRTIGFSGSPQYQVEVLGGRYTVHAF